MNFEEIETTIKIVTPSDKAIFYIDKQHKNSQMRFSDDSNLLYRWQSPACLIKALRELADVISDYIDTEANPES